jgi:hypothetical protein
MSIAILMPAIGSASAKAVVNPVLSGSVADSATLPGATAVAVAGHYAYVTDYYAGRLTAIDISNPSAPVIAGSSPPLNELLNASTVNIAGGYAFVASKNRNGPSGSESNDDGTGNSLTILDIGSNPASPSILGSVRDANTLFGAYGVAVSGRYAFVASQGCLSGQPCPNHSVGSAFAVIDIANPSAPTIVAALHNASLPLPWTGSGALSHATSVAISEGYAYVTAAYTNRLTIISIANPLSPKIVASLKDPTNLNVPVDVAVSGKYAYVVDQVWPGHLTVVGVSDPTKPQVVKSLESTSLTNAYRIRLRGNFAYISASGVAKVAIVDISNPPSPRLLATVESQPHLNRTTGLDVDTSGSHVVASSPYLSTQAQPLYPPYALQAGGPTLTGTVSTITLDPSPIAVAIAAESEPANPTAQTSSNFSFSVNDAVSTVLCQLDGGGWNACTTPTGQTYSELAGGPHTFQVQATGTAGNTSTAAYSWTVTPPANTLPPSISGTASVGRELSASAGSWTGSPAFAYQWLRCNELGLGCLPIGGATSASYTAAAADAGSTLEVQVTATTSAGSTPVESVPTTLVTAAPANQTPPNITGAPTEGQTLTASPGTWTGYPPPTLEYRWERCNNLGQACKAIPGATGPAYAPGPEDTGSTVVVTEEATNTAGTASASSTPTPVITAAPANQTPPAIAGTATAGQTLTASPGTWSGYPQPTLAQQWERCDQNGLTCNPINGASNPTYTLGPQDAGSTILLTEEATNTAGTASAQSAPTALVTAAPANQTPPNITGAPTEGQTLTASPGTWTGYPPPTLEYQWERCNSVGQSCATIPGASAPSYTALSADVGSTLVVTVTASNTAGSAQTSSSATAVVASAAGPLTPLLDNFARPNNSGPPGPNWTHMVVSSSSSTNDLYITNQQITGRSGSNADFWNPSAYGPNSEVWVTVAVKPTIDLDPVVLGLRFQNPGGASASGYQAYYIHRSSQPDQYKIIVRVNGTTSTTLASVNGPTLNPGDQLLFRAIGTTLELWRLDAGSWARVLSATDGTYQSAGYLNLTARDGTVRLANFGGGTLP